MSDKEPTIDEQITLGAQLIASAGISIESLEDYTKNLAEIFNEIDRIYWDNYLDKYKHLFENDNE